MAQAAIVTPAAKSESKPIPAAGVPAAAVAAPAVPRKHRQRQLSVGDFKPDGHFAQTQQALLAADCPFEEVFNPSFWASIAPILQNSAKANGGDFIGTEIEVRTRDLRFFARLIITGVRFNAHNVADGLMVDCIGPAYDIATGLPCPYSLKTRRPMPIERPAQAAA